MADHDAVTHLRPAGGPHTLSYGEAVLQRHADGTVTVERADDTIGIAGEVLAELAGEANPAAVRITAEGNLALGGGGEHVYRPVRFASEGLDGTFVVLVCERVTAGG